MEKNGRGAIKVKDLYDVQKCYTDFDGECYWNDLWVVIIGYPDDSGVWVEDPDTGDEHLAKCSEIYLLEWVYNAIRNN